MKKLSIGARALRKLAGGRDSLLKGAVAEVFRSVIGRSAANVPVLGFSSGTLQVAARNVNWRKELLSQQRSIITDMNRALGGNIVHRIELKPWPEKSPTHKNAAGEQGAEAVPLEPTEGLARAAERIRNPAARAAFISFGIALEGAGAARRNTK